VTRRDKAATLELKEFKLAELREQTITRADAIEIYSEQLTGFRARLFEIPGQVVNLSAEQRTQLEHAINRALAEFAGLPEPGPVDSTSEDLVDVDS
jgi:hypothetical protein